MQAEISRRNMQDVKLQQLSSMIPDRYKAVTRADVQNEAEAVNECRADESESIFLYGTGGTGKTMLASIWLRERVLAIEPEVDSFAWCNTSVLFMQLRCTMGRTATRDEEDVLSEIWKNKAVVIDDLGAESVTDYSKSSLYILLNTLCEKERQVFITSNLSLAEIAQQIGPRISDRIARMCKVVKMQQPRAYRKPGN